MRILVVTPMQREEENFKNALNKWGTLKNQYKVILSGVGKVNAASEVSATLVESFINCTHPSVLSYDIVAVVGYAAGTSKFTQGDILLPDKARYHDCRVPQGFIPELEEVYTLEGSDDITILTGDSFVDRELSLLLQEKYGKDIIFDMEATSVCQVCSEYNIPVILLKIISDIPEEDNLQSFEDFVNTHSDFTPFVQFLEYLQ